MKKRISAFIAILALMCGFVFAAPLAFADPVNVINGGDDACKDNTNICGNTPNKIMTIVKNVINTLLLAAGIIAVIMIIVGGLRYILSAGEQAQITAAKNTILYSVVGLVVASLSFAIVNFVVTNLF